MEQGERQGGFHAPSWLESLALFALLFGLWLILSDHYDLPTLLIGVGCCALVVALTPDRVLKVGRFDPHFGVPLGRMRPFALLRYGLWLFWAVVQANFQVARVVLDPRMPIDPKLLRFRVGYASRVAQVLLAHSITLTPGTVTIDLEDGRYLVHSLVPTSADAIASGEMQQGVAAACGEPVEAPPTVSWMHSVHDTGEVRVRSGELG